MYAHMHARTYALTLMTNINIFKLTTLKNSFHHCIGCIFTQLSFEIIY